MAGSEHDLADGETADLRKRKRPIALIGSYLAALVTLVVLNFLLPRSLPGKPLVALSDPQSATFVGDDSRRAAVEAYYGLDRPLVEQLGGYLSDLVHGDLGTSISVNVPVSRLLLERLPWTLLLAGTALLLATAVGVFAGIQSGWHRGGLKDRSLMTVFVASQNVPVFLISSAAVYVLAVQLGWFPLSGARTPFSQSWGLVRQTLDIAQHLVLPAAVLALQFAAFQYLLMRASMVSELGSEYLVHGRTMGLSERVLKHRYAARNSLLPVVSIVGLQVGSVVTAAIFVETVFAYPGLGRLMVESVGERDYPLMQGVFLLLAAIVLAVNLLAELAYRRLDPRVAR